MPLDIAKEEHSFCRYASNPRNYPPTDHADIDFSPKKDIESLGKLRQLTVNDWKSTKQSYHLPCSDEDAAVYASLLRRCSHLRTLSHGRRVHALILTCGHMGDTFLGNLLVQMYGSCGAMAEAASVFSSMPKKNVYSWNLLIGAYIQNGQGILVPPLYRHMQQKGVIPDQVTFVSTLSAFSGPSDLVEGQWMHVCMQWCGFECDAVAGTALLNMYGKCGSLQNALKMFNRILEKNVISWNAMFAVYTQHGQEKEALQLFQCMEMKGIIPNKVTFITLLPACTSQADIAEGKRMHVRILHDAFESGVNLENALLDMHGKCGALELACSVFTAMPERDVISWNVMVEAYIQQGENEEAFYLLKQMQEEGALPDEVSCISVLSACVNEAALAEGKRLHSRLVCGRFESDVIVGTALVNMYAKCGNLEGAHRTFDTMPHKNVVSWNAMIGAYAQHGLSNICLFLFQEMLLEGIVPTDSTYFSVLFACSHTGLLNEGCHWFHFMISNHGIKPTVEHFNCMVDLLGRAGQLDEGEALLCSMSCQPSAASWAALLSGCKMHSDVDRGIHIIEHVIRTNPESAAPYVSLSNIYAAVGRWDEAEKIQQERKGRRKLPDSVIDYDFWDEEFLTGSIWHCLKGETLVSCRA